MHSGGFSNLFGMAGLGLSAVLSLSGSDSGRSVKLIKRADLPWGEGGEQRGFLPGEFLVKNRLIVHHA